MLDDRPYMREAGHRPQFRMMSERLMIALVGVFALQCINDVYLGTRMEQYLALTVEGLRHGFLWQLITFQFLHGTLFHLLGNLIMLWFFGRSVEGVLGARRFLFAYLSFGVCGGLLQGVLMLLFPNNYGLAMYGASAGTSGLFAVFAMLDKRSEIRWNFVIPIRAGTLLGIYAAIAAFFTLVPSPRDNIAHAAHLGGILAGIGFVRLGWHHTYVQLPWMDWWKNRRPRIRIVKEPKRASPARERVTREQPRTVTPTDFMASEVDPILDKISAHGIHSLTERERAILEKAQKNISKR